MQTEAPAIPLPERPKRPRKRKVVATTVNEPLERCQLCKQEKPAHTLRLVHEYVGKRQQTYSACPECAESRPTLFQTTSFRPHNRAQRRQLDQQSRRDRRHAERWAPLEPTEERVTRGRIRWNVVEHEAPAEKPAKRKKSA